MMNFSKETIRITTKTLSFGVLVLLILFAIFTMTGSCLPDNGSSGQLNPEFTSVYQLDADHHHLGDGVKPELMPADAEGKFYTKTFGTSFYSGTVFISNLIVTFFNKNMTNSGIYA